MEEKSIELEGARAQLRVIESKSLSKSDYGSPEHTIRSTIMLPPVTLHTPSQSQSSLYRDANQISTPSMKAMIPLAMDDATLHHSSSTESAQDHAERDNNKCPDTPKRRPSKIPLPGQKGYVAPKPPSGKISSAGQSRNLSGPPSNKSLSKSTGSLQVMQGPNSITKSTNPSPNRSDSAHSLRKDMSIEKSRNCSNSSIPVSSIGKGTPPSKQPHNTSPVLSRVKRDSLTNRVKNLDSLSRYMSTSLNNNSKSPLQTSSTTTTTITLTKKDLGSSFTINNNNSITNNSSSSSSNSRIGRVIGGGGNQQPQAPMRRSSSSSTTMHRYHHQSSINNIGSNHSNSSNNLNGSSNNQSSQQDVNTDNASSAVPDTNKVRGGFRTNFWNWLKI